MRAEDFGFLDSSEFLSVWRSLKILWYSLCPLRFDPRAAAVRNLCVTLRFDENFTTLNWKWNFWDWVSLCSENKQHSVYNLGKFVRFQIPFCRTTRTLFIAFAIFSHVHNLTPTMMPHLHKQLNFDFIFNEISTKFGAREEETEKNLCLGWQRKSS